MKKALWIVSPAPFLITRPTVTRMSVITALTLIPQLALLAISGEYRVLAGIGVAVIGSILAELCTAIPGRKNTFGDGTVLIAGLLTGFLLPSNLNLFIIFAVSFSGILSARVLFGGAGSCWMNPVAAAVCIAYISQPDAFPPFLVNADGIRTVGDAFGSLRLDHFSQLVSDQSLTNSINTGLFGRFGIKLPEGYLTLFWNSPSVIPAFRYNVITLLSSIVLISMNIIDWIVPLFFLLAYGLCVRFFSLLPFSPGFAGGDILFALLTSGILFIVFYVLADYTTTPRSRGGKAASGILAGLIAFILCGPGGSPVGGVFTVILVNALNPILEYLENRMTATRGASA